MRAVSMAVIVSMMMIVPVVMPTREQEGAGYVHAQADDGDDRCFAEGDRNRLKQGRTDSTAIPSAISPSTIAEANPARSPTLPVPKL